MTKLAALALIGLITSFAAQSQRASFIWGEESKKMAQPTYYYAKGKGTEIIQLSFKANKHGMGGFASYTAEPIVVKFSKRMERLEEKSLSELDKNTQFNSFINLAGKLYLFTSTYNKEDKSTSFYYRLISNQSLDWEGEKVLLGKFAISKLGVGEQYRHNGGALINLMPGGNSIGNQQSADFIASEDSSKILMLTSAPAAQKENEKFAFAMFGNTMNKLWDKTVELPYPSKFIDLLNSFVTNDGKVGLVIKHYDKEVTKEKIKENGENMPAYKTRLLVYDNSSAPPLEYTLNMGDKFLHSVDISADRNGGLNLFGLYQQTVGGNINGYFTLSLNLQNKDLPIETFTAFPTALVDLVKADKQADKKDSHPGIGSEFGIKKVLRQEDGSKHYLLEYYARDYSTGFNSNTAAGQSMTYTTNWFIYGDIIDIKIDADKTTSAIRLPKNQISAAVYGSSGFEATTYKDKVVFLYNDYAKNLELDLSAPAPKSGMGSFGEKVLIMTILDEKGSFKRSIIYDNSADKFTPSITAGVWIEKNKMVLNAFTPQVVIATKTMPGILEIK